MDDSPLPGLIPSGGSMSPGPDMPVPALPGGNMLSQAGGTLANALQGSIGYATRDPQLEKAAIDREQDQAKYRIMLPVGQALADAQAKLAAGDLEGANAAYQRVGHLSMVFPAIRDFGTKLAEQSMALKVRQASGDVLGKLDPLAGAFARSGGDPKEALAIAKHIRESGEWTPVTSPNTGETTFVSKYLKNSDGTPQTLGVVNGLIKVNPGETLATTSRDESGNVKVTPAYTAPVSVFAKDAPAGVREQLDVPEYDRLRLQERNGISEAGPLADAMYRQAQARHLASQNPEEVKIAAAQAGIDPVRARSGELSRSDADALAARIDARKNAQITLNADTTTRARLSVEPDTRILVRRDGTGQTLSGVDKITAAKMIASGEVAPLTPDAQKQLELTQTLRPQIQTLNELAIRLYPLQKEQPGLTVVQAIKLAVDRHLMSGDEARVYSGALAAVSTGMSRVETGTVRPGQQTQEWFRTKVLPGDAESLTSVAAKLREANKMIDNRIDALSQRGLRHNSTNPFNDPDIKRIQGGERPTSVDDNGVFQFPEPITTSGGIKIRGR